MQEKAPRQGDLLFVPREKGSITNLDQKHPAFRKNGIIREGEATGHHHEILDKTTADVFWPQDGRPVVVVGPLGATVKHPEHGPVKLMPETIYDVHLAREHDLTSPKHIRYVAD